MIEMSSDGEGLCAPETISRLESGKQVPKLYMVNAILDKLGIKGSQLSSMLASSKEVYNLNKAC